MAYENNKSFEERRNTESIFSKRIKAGKRRTYFFDVRETRGSDYFITITESKRKSNEDGYERHKVFIYKEDFNKFLEALTETVNYVKTDLMPDFDFDAFRHDDQDEYPYNSNYETEGSLPAPIASSIEEEPTPVVASLSNTDQDEATDVDTWKM